MFEKMLDHPNIAVMLGTDYRQIAACVPHRRLIYTGPIDEYFDFRHGKLPYRSLRFEHATLATERAQPTGTVNYPQTEDFTRISEYKHMTGQTHPMTAITREYPAAEGDPYYPILHPDSAAMFKRYEALAARTPDVLFVGRLSTFRYYNMDQVTGQALATFRRIEERWPKQAAPSLVRPQRAASGDRKVPAAA
jgi:UDP-galactopyranose mutase